MKKIIINVILLIVLLAVGVFFGGKYYLNKDLNNKSFLVTGWGLTTSYPSNIQITLNFENYKINGNSGINNYGGSYKLWLENKISFNDVYSTEMASTDQTINSMEITYFSLLSKVKYYELKGNTLKLLDENKNVVIILEKK